MAVGGVNPTIKRERKVEKSLNDVSEISDNC